MEFDEPVFANSMFVGQPYLALKYVCRYLDVCLPVRYFYFTMIVYTFLR